MGNGFSLQTPRVDGQDTIMCTHLWVPPANFNEEVVGEIERRNLLVAQETLGKNHRLVLGVHANVQAQLELVSGSHQQKCISGWTLGFLYAQSNTILYILACVATQATSGGFTVKIQKTIRFLALMAPVRKHGVVLNDNAPVRS